MQTCAMVDSIYAADAGAVAPRWFERAMPREALAPRGADFHCFELIAETPATGAALWASYQALADARAAGQGYAWCSIHEYWWCGAFVLARLREPVEGSGFTAVCRAETWCTTGDVRELAPLAL